MGQMHEYHDVHTFDQTQRSQLREKDHADALIKGIMTVNITIRDKMYELWKKRVGGGQLIGTV